MYPINTILNFNNLEVAAAINLSVYRYYYIRDLPPYLSYLSVYQIYIYIYYFSFKEKITGKNWRQARYLYKLNGPRGSKALKRRLPARYLYKLNIYTNNTIKFFSYYNYKYREVLKIYTIYINWLLIKPLQQAQQPAAGGDLLIIQSKYRILDNSAILYLSILILDPVYIDLIYKKILIYSKRYIQVKSKYYYIRDLPPYLSYLSVYQIYIYIYYFSFKEKITGKNWRQARYLYKLNGPRGSKSYPNLIQTVVITVLLCELSRAVHNRDENKQ
ncbi:hypothetical protein BO71DRAFT_409601 [Aspergillus ellipticus CBS 707.79]|uniref:Uncharacterized protein n=1 Tax=Aspergillus ellipticus CBS 707.79 TaxID=1448320 RepID=A0A319DJ97_9EURO|nr:hypothetical protein BO71DRAFT_409601 [Aspergillus ellipticus CBS 707.79]